MNIVIIGAGQAAATLAFKLRERGFKGTITLLGKEAAYPYQRPPLSKKYLNGLVSADDLLIRNVEQYTEHAIQVYTSTQVESIDLQRRLVITDSGKTFAWDRLVFATGAMPRPLPQEAVMQAKNVFSLRNLRDCDAIAGYMAAGRKLCIIGGGYIGLELAAVARSQGMTVTVVERESRILQRVACQQTAEFVTRYHQAHHVNIRCREEIETFEMVDNQVRRVILKSGESIETDVVVAGIGVIPEVALAGALGIIIESGAIKVDAYCQTSLDNIYAIGDCSIFTFRGRTVRLESVQNALEQAETVAYGLTGNRYEYQPKPWFWSDQGQLKIQIAGLALQYNSVVSRISPGSLSASFWYFNEDELIAVDAINDARAFMLGRRMIGKTIGNKEKIADIRQELKSLLLCP